MEVSFCPHAYGVYLIEDPMIELLVSASAG